MKNRRSIIAVFLMVAVLCLAVGYANVADDLSINGTLSLSNDALDEIFEANVTFADPAITNASTANKTGVTAELDTDTDKLIITVPDTAFKAIGETLVVTVKAVNSGTAAATVTVDNVTDGTYFDVEITPNVETELAAAANGVNSEIEYTITITLTGMPAGDATDTIAIALTATAVTV